VRTMLAVHWQYKPPCADHVGGTLAIQTTLFRPYQRRDVFMAYRRGICVLEGVSDPRNTLKNVKCSENKDRGINNPKRSLFMHKKYSSLFTLFTGIVITSRPRIRDRSLVSLSFLFLQILHSTSPPSVSISHLHLRSF